MARSQTMVVSRWLVMPSATTFTRPTLASAACWASVTHSTTLLQISIGSCSTHLLLCDLINAGLPESDGLGNKMAVCPVLPASIPQPVGARAGLSCVY